MRGLGLQVEYRDCMLLYASSYQAGHVGTLKHTARPENMIWQWEPTVDLPSSREQYIMKDGRWAGQSLVSGFDLLSRATLRAHSRVYVLDPFLTLIQTGTCLGLC